MNPKSNIEDFLTQKRLAVVGVSQAGNKVSNMVLKNLKKKGYEVYPVNPKAKSIDGETCYPNVIELPEQVGGAVLVVPPTETEKVVKDLAEAGIHRVWMQPGAESEDAIHFCENNAIEPVYGKCIMVLSKPLNL